MSESHGVNCVDMALQYLDCENDHQGRPRCVKDRVGSVMRSGTEVLMWMRGCRFGFLYTYDSKNLTLYTLLGNGGSPQGTFALMYGK